MEVRKIKIYVISAKEINKVREYPPKRFFFKKIAD